MTTKSTTISASKQRFFPVLPSHEAQMLLGLPIINHEKSRTLDGMVHYPPLSLVDIGTFLLALVPELVRPNPNMTLVSCLASTVVFVCFSMPISLAFARLPLARPVYPFPKQPTLLQDIVIRLVRHAFLHFPHTIGRAFFSEPASVPLFTRRLGGERSFSRDCVRVETTNNVLGWWITPNGARPLASEKKLDGVDELPPDVILMYLHGGGLTMGSPAFYLQFLLLLSLELKTKGYHRPAIFAPVYGLAPESLYKDQLSAVVRAWKHVLSKTAQDTLIGAGGDSAGGGLAISMLFSLSEDDSTRKPDFVRSVLPFSQDAFCQSHCMSSLISPWTSLLHPPPSDSTEISSDYVSPPALAHFAHLASGAQPRARSPGLMSYLSTPPFLPYPFASTSPPQSFDPLDVVRRHRVLCAEQPLISPGDIEDEQAWVRAFEGVRGVYVTYGTGEVLAPQVHALLGRLRRIAQSRDQHAGTLSVEERAWPFVHAAPIVYCFLGWDKRERAQGVEDIAQFISHTR
jgi:acetyl esterase/lipase